MNATHLSIVALPFVFQLVMPVYSMSQNCGSVVNCSPDYKYPYRTCPNVGSEYPIVCTNTLHNIAGKTVLRNTLPLCARFEESASTPADQSVNKVGGGTAQIFDRSQIISDIDAMVDAWNCICNITTSNITLRNQRTCCLRIRFTQNPDDIDGPIMGQGANLATTHNSVTCTGSGAPTLNCWQNEDNYVLASREYTAVNNHPDWRRVSTQTGVYFNAWYTGPNLPTNLEDPPLLHSFRSIVLHELGHWMGIEHPDNGPPDFAAYCQPPVRNIGNTAMRSKSFANSQPIQLSMEDKCAFMKLYCPQLTGVLLYEANLIVKSGKAIIVENSLSLCDLYQIDPQMAVSIWSINGDYLETISIGNDNGNCNLQLLEYKNQTLVLLVNSALLSSDGADVIIVQVSE